jgi:hypothetical protein
MLVAVKRVFSPLIACCLGIRTFDVLRGTVRDVALSLVHRFNFDLDYSIGQVLGIGDNSPPTGVREPELQGRTRHLIRMVLQIQHFIALCNRVLRVRIWSARKTLVRLVRTKIDPHRYRGCEVSAKVAVLR